MQGLMLVLLQLSAGRHWLAVLVVPLLYESRLYELMDATMVLSAPGQAQVHPLHTQHTLNHISIVLNVPSMHSQYALIMLSLYSHCALTCFWMCSHLLPSALSLCSH